MKSCKWSTETEHKIHQSRQINPMNIRISEPKTAKQSYCRLCYEMYKSQMIKYAASGYAGHCLYSRGVSQDRWNRHAEGELHGRRVRTGALARACSWWTSVAGRHCRLVCSSTFTFSFVFVFIVIFFYRVPIWYATVGRHMWAISSTVVFDRRSLFVRPSVCLSVCLSVTSRYPMTVKTMLIKSRGSHSRIVQEFLFLQPTFRPCVPED